MLRYFKDIANYSIAELRLIKKIIEIASNEEEYVLDCYVGSGTTMATAHKLNRHYIGIEIGEQITDLVVKRLNKVIEGEQGGISGSVNWHGGGEFLFYNFNETKTGIKSIIRQNQSKTIHAEQLSFLELFEQYKLEPITQNIMVREDIKFEYGTMQIHCKPPIVLTKNLLICNVKKDNLEQYLNESGKIYYTGRKFPTTVALNKLFYFMPYLSGKGIRDLYYIKIARLGYRKEGQEKEDRNDLRLVFEIEYVGQLFEDYQKVKLEIWRTFTDTTIEKLLCKNNLTDSRKTNK